MNRLLSYLSWKKRILLSVLGVFWSLFPFLVFGIALNSGWAPLSFLAIGLISVVGLFRFTIPALVTGSFFNTTPALFVVFSILDAALWVAIFIFCAALVARKKARRALQENA